MGWKAVVASISDLYVKGVKPLGLTISLCLPNLDIEKIRSIAHGIKGACNRYGLKVYKWDTNKSIELSISVACIGITKRSIPLRSGLKMGDLLLVSDTFGLETLGLKILLGEIVIEDKKIKELAISRFLQPSPDFNKLLKIYKEHYLSIHAAIDSSDGLAKSLWELSKSSNKKIKLLNIPVDPQLYKLNLSKKTILELALYGGEEYQAIISVDKTIRNYLIKLGFIEIGRICGRGIGVYDNEGHLIEDRGWEHFKN